MLIGGASIRNDVITLGACFHVFFNVCLHSPSLPLLADWWKSDGRPGATGELEAEFKFQRRTCKLYFLFPPRAPESLLAGYDFLLFLFLH